MADYQAIMDEATAAANEAGQEWMDKMTARGPKYEVVDSFSGRSMGTMLDVCGFAWIEFKDRRSAFYRWCKKVANEENKNRGWRTERTLHRVPIRTDWDGHQEMGLKQACMDAATEVLRSHGISVYSCSRID